jgi:hypothetical protein
MRIQVEEGAVWLEYTLHGSGPTKIFFVHGFATTVSSWRFQVDYFGNEHSNQFQICVMDNRGMGPCLSRCQNSFYTFELFIWTYLFAFCTIWSGIGCQVRLLSFFRLVSQAKATSPQDSTRAYKSYSPNTFETNMDLKR